VASVSDRAAVVLAGAVALGAWWSGPVPTAVGILALVVAVAWRQPLVLAGAGLLLAAALGHRAWAGLEPPDPVEVAPTAVTLVSDPEVDGDVVEVLARLGHRRVELAVPAGPDGEVVADRLAGERIVVGGRLVPVTGRPDLAVRHVAARILVDEVGPFDEGDLASRTANDVRRAVVRGATSLGPASTALLAGILFGDDRGQSPATVDDFRAAGLTHLLAVSGQNVAFVLVVVGPVLRRLSLLPRFLAVLGVLAFFALLTRFEPSVLRATAMAAIAAAHTFGGRELGRHRSLALAVAILLLIDPVLVRSVGFALSVAATAGIVAWAARIEARMPGPRWLAEPLAITLAAQLAVAPLLATVFGGVPLVSLPANLLAGPAAGLVMVWGLVASPVAGIVPALATVLHLPDRLALAWLGGVARGAAAVPSGELRVAHVVAVGVLFLVARRRALRPLAVTGLAIVVAMPGVALARRPELVGDHVASGAQVWRDGAAVVVRVDGRARAGPVLVGLRRSGVRRVGLVLVGGDSTTADQTADAIAERGGTDIVSDAAPGDRIRQGPITAEARPDGDTTRWLVRIDRLADGSVRSAGARGPRRSPVGRDPPGARARGRRRS
jgi:competence protein ComEC